MIPHHQGGCINCGNPRFSQQEINQCIDLSSRNIYVRANTGTEVILGLCQACFASDAELDLEAIHDRLWQQELALLELQNKDAGLVEPIRNMVFVGYRKQGA